MEQLPGQLDIYGNMDISPIVKKATERKKKPKTNKLSALEYDLLEFKRILNIT